MWLLKTTPSQTANESTAASQQSAIQLSPCPGVTSWCSHLHFISIFMKIWCFFQDVGRQLVHIDHRAEIRSHDQGRLLLCRAHKKGGLGMLMEDRAGEVLSLAVGFKCCWEANQGVEGSENAPEQLKAFCFSVGAQPGNRESPHMAGGGGKVESRCVVFVPVAAQSTSWTTRPEGCWTSWRRWATSCSQ